MVHEFESHCSLSASYSLASSKKKKKANVTLVNESPTCMHVCFFLVCTLIVKLPPHGFLVSHVASRL